MTQEIKLPFAGFYCSMWEDMLDREEDQAVEWFASNNDYELREIENAVFFTASYGLARRYVAEEYVGYFNQMLVERFGIDLGLGFALMTSPREYNFVTDRVFAKIEFAKLQELRRLVDDAALEATIKEYCTSREGFISFYSNRISDWLEKPLVSWDHNETGTLLLALLADQEDWEWGLCERMDGNGVANLALDKAIDWDAVKKRLDDQKEEAT